MALDFKKASDRGSPYHSVLIGEHSELIIERLTATRFRLRTRSRNADDGAISRGWGAEVTRGMVIEIMKSLAQLSMLMAEEEDEG